MGDKYWNLIDKGENAILRLGRPISVIEDLEYELRRVINALNMALDERDALKNDLIDACQRENAIFCDYCKYNLSPLEESPCDKCIESNPPEGFEYASPEERGEIG